MRPTKIKARRLDRKLSANDLAVLVGVHAPTIYRIENGHQEPLVGLAMKLAKALKCRVEDIFEAPPSRQRKSA